MPRKNNRNKEKFELENFSEKVWKEDLNVGLTGSYLSTKIFVMSIFDQVLDVVIAYELLSSKILEEL